MSCGECVCGCFPKVVSLAVQNLRHTSPAPLRRHTQTETHNLFLFLTDICISMAQNTDSLVLPFLCVLRIFSTPSLNSQSKIILGVKIHMNKSK